MLKHEYIRTNLPASAVGFIPYRISKSNKLTIYETVRLAKGFEGTERTLRILNSFGWLLNLNEASPYTGEVFQLDIIDDQGDALQTWQISKSGFNFLRGKFGFKRVGLKDF